MMDLLTTLLLVSVSKLDSCTLQSMESFPSYALQGRELLRNRGFCNLSRAEPSRNSELPCHKTLYDLTLHLCYFGQRIGVNGHV
jgi:hypothetical protein